MKVTATQQKDFELVLIPEGMYKAKLNEITGKKKDGSELEGTIEGSTNPLWKWTFEVIDGKYKSKEIAGISSQKFSIPTDRSGRVNPAKAVLWAEGILGREIKSGEDIDLDDLIGMECQILVEDKNSGMTDKDGKIMKQSSITKVKPKA